MKHCCIDMEEKSFSDGCCTNENKVIYYSSAFREYGIPIRGEGFELSSYLLIDYCPWCGKRLPESKRTEWFEELGKKGYDRPFEQDIPAEYKCSDWHEKK